MEPEWPAVMVRDVGEAEREKSGAGATVRLRVVEWVSVSEVAVTVMVEEPGAAEDEAVKVTLCGVPGVRVSDEGLAVTPDGRPEKVTVTGLLNPFCAVDENWIAVPVWPGVRLRDVGDAEKLKFGAAATVRSRVAACARLPEVAVKTS